MDVKIEIVLLKGDRDSAYSQVLFAIDLDIRILSQWFANNQRIWADLKSSWRDSAELVAYFRILPLLL